jgi:hypothetical protein
VLTPEKPHVLGRRLELLAIPRVREVPETTTAVGSRSFISRIERSRRSGMK